MRYFLGVFGSKGGEEVFGRDWILVVVDGEKLVMF